MRRASVWGLWLAVGLSLGLWLRANYFTDEARIRRAVRGLLSDMSFATGTGNIGKMAKFNRVSDRFTDDIIISVEQVVPLAPPLNGREEVHQALQATFTQLSRCDVTLHDLIVRPVPANANEARAAFTASALTSRPGIEFAAQEFEVRLRKNENGQWLLAQVAAVRTLKR